MTSCRHMVYEQMFNKQSSMLGLTVAFCSLYLGVLDEAVIHGATRLHCWRRIASHCYNTQSWTELQLLFYSQVSKLWTETASTSRIKSYCDLRLKVFCNPFLQTCEITYWTESTHFKLQDNYCASLFKLVVFHDHFDALMKRSVVM